jgi:hypothetical protein
LIRKTKAFGERKLRISAIFELRIRSYKEDFVHSVSELSSFAFDHTRRIFVHSVSELSSVASIIQGGFRALGKCKFSSLDSIIQGGFSCTRQV